ncbi:amidohydrolase family protein [bacterium]|nr:amidohydrolase family protein [bacterium]
MSTKLLLQNGYLLHPQRDKIERADLVVEGNGIVRVAPRIDAEGGETVIDLDGKLVIPGLVVGHHHLYSALACTMPPPPRAPKDFHEILELIWWRLDRALDKETVELSGLAGALEAARCGVTTMIDHHASPGYIAGSLDALRDGIAAVGQRAVLCYEVTGRNGGKAEQDAGLAENERFLSANTGPFFAGMVGAHAAFTIDDEGLEGCQKLAERMGVPVHIHVAEDPCDDAICREQFGASLMARLDSSGILSKGNLFGHCTHLSNSDIKRVKQAGCFFAHNTRSNMNNSVGYAPVGLMAECAVLGTDGIGSDMLEEFRVAAFRSNEGKTGLGWGDLVAMLYRGAELAGQRLGVKLGRLETGYQADLAILDRPPAMVDGLGSVAGHFLFSLASRHVTDTMVAGEWILRDRQIVKANEAEAVSRLEAAVPELWKRLPAE